MLEEDAVCANTFETALAASSLAGVISARGGPPARREQRKSEHREKLFRQNLILIAIVIPIARKSS